MQGGCGQLSDSTSGVSVAAGEEHPKMGGPLLPSLKSICMPPTALV